MKGPKQKGVYSYCTFFVLSLGYADLFLLCVSVPLRSLPCHFRLPIALPAVSNFRQKPFAGALNGYIFWGAKRWAQQVPYFAIPFITGYAVYAWGKEK